MANVTFTPQDYTSTLAMLFHEAGGPAVQNLLKRGDNANALGYVSGLIDTWANRSAASGTPMWQLMNQPNQISHWDPSQIQQKANALDPRIKALADAYLTNRADGGANFNPGVVNYMNTEFVKNDNPNGSWKDWYDPKNVVGAYGDYKAGRNSLQTEFITQPKKQPVPNYTFSFDKSLKLSPTDTAQQAYSTLAGRLSGLKPPQAGTDGFGAGTDVSGDTANGTFGSATGVIETGQPYWFSQGDFSTGVGNGSLGTGIIPYNTIDPRSFAGRLAVGDALGAGDGSLQNPGGVFETGNPYGFSTGDALQSYYRNALGRDADPEGLASWQGAIHPGGLTLGQALDQIASSPEATARAAVTGVDPRTYAIADAYASQLHRLPEQEGLSNWMAQLSQGASLDSVLNRISASPEAQRADLTDFYQRSFGRPADTGGMQAALDQLAQGRSLQAVETQLLQSPEAQTRGITPGQFASLITPDLYGTPTINTGTQVGTTGAGASTGTIGAGTLTPTVGAGSDTGTIGASDLTPTVGPGTAVGTLGPGGLTPTINDYYNAILQRAPDAQGAQDYQGQIDRGVPANLVEAQILSSPEAAQTLGPDRLTQLVNDYQVTNGIRPQDAATLGPLASDFVQLVGRPVDTPTIQHWDQQIQSGMPLGAVEAQIIAAPEAQQARAASLDGVSSAFQAKYGLTPTEAATLSPSSADYAKLIGPGADVGTVGAGPAVGTVGAGPAIGTLGPSFTADTIQGALTGTIGAGPAQQAFTGAFDPNAYLAENKDVAAAGMDPLQHFLRYGYAEGRAVDTVGDHLPQNFDGNAYLAQNPDVARAGMSPLEHYLRYGAAEGRAAPTGSAPYSFTGLNASQGLGPVGNGTFSGTFDGNAYLAANPDVKAAGMDPLLHYLTYGFNEGRALDPQGDRINQGFDPNAYLAQNQDVAAAHMDPLAHYLEYGAHEGRAAPTGNNPYSFSNFNPSQGLGTGNGSFGVGGITGGASAQPTAPVAALPSFGAGLNVSSGVSNGAFGLGGITAGGNAGSGVADPYGFSGANVSNALGATSQTFGSLYPAGGASSGGGGASDPFGFSAANVSGYDPNAGSAPAPTSTAGGGGGSGGGPTTDPAGELAYLNTQASQILSQYTAGLPANLQNPNNYNAGLAAIGQQATAGQLNSFGQPTASTPGYGGGGGITAGAIATPIMPGSVFNPGIGLGLGAPLFGSRGF